MHTYSEILSVQQALPPPQFEDYEVHEIMRDLEAKAKGLPADQREKFLARCQSLAREILSQIRELRVGRDSGKSLGNEAERLFTQLKTEGERLLVVCAKHDVCYATYTQRMDALGERLLAMELHPTEFITPTPSVGRNFDDVVLQRLKMHQEQMGSAPVVAAANVDNGVKSAAKSVLDSAQDSKAKESTPDVNRAVPKFSFPSEGEIAKCLTEHPRLQDTQTYLTEKGIISRIAKSFANQTKVPIDMRMEIMDIVDDVGLTVHNTFEASLILAVRDCAQKP